MKEVLEVTAPVKGLVLRLPWTSIALQQPETFLDSPTQDLCFLETGTLMITSQENSAQRVGAFGFDVK